MRLRDRVTRNLQLLQEGFLPERSSMLKKIRPVVINQGMDLILEIGMYTVSKGLSFQETALTALSCGVLVGMHLPYPQSEHQMVALGPVLARPEVRQPASAIMEDIRKGVRHPAAYKIIEEVADAAVGSKTPTEIIGIFLTYGIMVGVASQEKIN